MNLAIQKERETPLLGRKRVTAIVESSGATPSRLDLQKRLADELKVDHELIIIKHIFSRFGEADVKVIAHLYSDKEKLEVIEDSYLKKKHVHPEKTKEKAEEATPAPAEAPAEEAKEAAAENPSEAAEEAPVEKKEEAEAPAEKSE